MTDPPATAPPRGGPATPRCRVGWNPSLSGWMTDPPLPASHCITSRWPCRAPRPRAGWPRCCPAGRPRPAAAGQPLHHREMAPLRQDKERGVPGVGRLDDRPAVAGQYSHCTAEMAGERGNAERGGPGVVRLGDRPAVAGQPPNHLQMAAATVVARCGVQRGAPTRGCSVRKTTTRAPPCAACHSADRPSPSWPSTSAPTGSSSRNAAWRAASIMPAIRP